MKILFTLLFILFSLTSVLFSQTIWFVNSTTGDDLVYTGLSPLNIPPGSGPKRTITGVVNTGALNNGDIIHIAAGIYTDCPTISRNITINGYSFAGSTDVIFNVSTASMSFHMTGMTTFSLNAVSAYGLSPASRFYFIGSDNTGIKIFSGSVLLSTAYFYITPPFLFQTNIPASTVAPPMTWYVDRIIGYDANSGLSPTLGGPGVGPVTSISHLIAVGLSDNDLINIATGNYNDGWELFKNIKINGYRNSGVADVEFNLSATNMIFHMTGRTTFKVGSVGTLTAADKFQFTGSTGTGIVFKTGCVHLMNTVFNIVPPFLFQGEITTGVIETKTIPEKYDLMQCYPNPFNPSTTISYAIPYKSFVKITVYDILGREIKVLVNEEKNAGDYKVSFNSNNLTSGIYFYNIKAGDFIKTRKMILLK